MVLCTDHVFHSSLIHYIFVLVVFHPMYLVHNIYSTFVNKFETILLSMVTDNEHIVLAIWSCRFYLGILCIRFFIEVNIFRVSIEKLLLVLGVLSTRGKSPELNSVLIRRVVCLVADNFQIFDRLLPLLGH